MALETGTYISDLVASNPTSGDPKAQGDDHLRLLKALLLATFPNITGAVTATHTQINTVAGLSAEGSWTPALAGLGVAGTGWTYSIQSGSYVRVGNLVFVSGRVTLTAVSGTATGQIAITGLPLAIASGNGRYGSMSISWASLTTSVTNMTGLLTPGDSHISLRRNTAAAASETPIVLADLSASTTLYFSGHYITA